MWAHRALDSQKRLFPGLSAAAAGAAAEGRGEFPGEDEAAVLLYSSADAVAAAPKVATQVSLSLTNLPAALRAGTEARVARATPSFYTAIGCHSLGMYTVILLS